MSSFSTRSLWVRLGKSHYLEMNDRELLERIGKNSDANAYCVLYDRYKQQLFNYYFALYQNTKRAQKEMIQLFLEVYQKRANLSEASFIENALKLAVSRYPKINQSQQVSSSVDELAFIEAWNAKPSFELIEDFEHMDTEMLSHLIIWLTTDLSKQAQANLWQLSPAQWQRQLGAALSQWHEVNGTQVSAYATELSEKEHSLKKKARALIWQNLDPEVDFIFWSRFEKECQAKGSMAKLWAPGLLLVFLSLVMISAYYKKELPGQDHEDRGPFSLTAPSSSDQPLPENDL